MLKTKIIALFLSLMMTLQMLPLAQIGSMLSGNQWTEELPHSSDEDGKVEMLKFSSTLPPEQFELASYFSECRAMLRLHISEKIPSNHSTDVVTPPPDVMA